MYSLLVVVVFLGSSYAMEQPVMTMSGGAGGDPHYRTYDGAELNFQGACRYILSGTDDRFDHLMGDRSWKVYVQNKHMYNPVNGEMVAFTSIVHIEAFKHVISIREHFKCWIDGKEELGPEQLRHGKVVGMHNQCYIQAEVVDEEIVAVIVTCPKLNFQVRFDGRGDGGRHWASVSLLAYRQDLSDLMELKGKLYGLLGNFDGDIENDLVPRGGSKTGTPTELGNSYQLDKETCGF